MKFGKIFPFLKKGNLGENILLTGIPRSGTTLACRLLSEYSQTVALNEPMDQDQFENPEYAKQNIDRCFKQFRKSLIKNGTAIARTQDGQITDNAYSNDSDNRERVVKRSAIYFDKKLNDDFTLVMKHCAEFTLLLPSLSESYSTFAIIRNPLALLASWVSVDVPVSRGKVAKSSRLNPVFHSELNKIGDDILQRQLFILSWYFGQYNNFHQDNIIKYEELVISPTKLLNIIAKGKSDSLNSQLNNKNASNSSNKQIIQKVGDALLNSEGNYWNYYTKNEVSNLLHKVIGNA